MICGVVDSNGKVLDTVRFDYPDGCTIDQILKYITNCWDDLKQWNCTVCGVAIPGLADPSNGVWKYSPFSGIENIPIAELLEERIGLPVYIDNDVNICALAELRFGACHGIDNFLWMTVSNGIGGGLILNSELYCGAGMSAGEIGHFVVEENTERICGCGNKGCLEAMASGASIAAIYNKMTGKNITAKEIASLAYSGEAEAIQVFVDAGRYIGKAAAYAVNLLNLEAVVLGGGVANSFDFLEPHIEDAFSRYVFKHANPEVKIIKTTLGYHAALIGCAALAAYQLEKKG